VVALATLLVPAINLGTETRPAGPLPVPEQTQSNEKPPCAEEQERKDAPPPQNLSLVAVYFSCEANIGTRNLPVYMLAREMRGEPTIENRMRTALTEYLEGPTQKETDRGYVTPLGASIPEALESVMVEGSEATVSFSPTIEEYATLATTAGQVLIGEISAVVFQFPQIERLNLQVSGDCERFWRLLESVCSQLSR
jgi:Sporulation and spore germination